MAGWREAGSICLRCPEWPRPGCSQHPLGILRMGTCHMHAGQWGLTVWMQRAGQSLGLGLPDEEALPLSEAE